MVNLLRAVGIALHFLKIAQIDVVFQIAATLLYLPFN